MSIASDYANAHKKLTDLANARPRFRLGESSFVAIIDDQGDLKFPGQSWAKPADAVALAHWILEYFTEPKSNLPADEERFEP